VRLKLKNPNFGQEKLVSNPAYAKDELIYSPWTQLQGAITIPDEEYTFAVDPAVYREKVEEEFKDSDQLKRKLQVKDDQAVIEIARWMEEVPIGSGTREPVGAWVVADVPTGRGEIVGRKHYVKLPLWSAVNSQYILREITDRFISGKKDVQQPKGWLVDFTSQDILVDFEGGRVKTKTRNGEVTEDAGTELLIVGPNGELEVKKSIVDEGDPKRKSYTSEWDAWIKKVEARKEASVDDTGFQRGPGSGAPPPP
jgi:hypothetical protein